MIFDQFDQSQTRIHHTADPTATGLRTETTLTLVNVRPNNHQHQRQQTSRDRSKKNGGKTTLVLASDCPYPQVGSSIAEQTCQTSTVLYGRRRERAIHPLLKTLAKSHLGSSSIPTLARPGLVAARSRDSSKSQEKYDEAGAHVASCRI